MTKQVAGMEEQEVTVRRFVVAAFCCCFFEGSMHIVCVFRKPSSKLGGC